MLVKVCAQPGSERACMRAAQALRNIAHLSPDNAAAVAAAVPPPPPTVAPTRVPSVHSLTHSLGRNRRAVGALRVFAA